MLARIYDKTHFSQLYYTPKIQKERNVITSFQENLNNIGKDILLLTSLIYILRIFISQLKRDTVHNIGMEDQYKYVIQCILQFI